MTISDRPRLLLVEDEYLLAQDLAYRLSQLGAEIVAFAPTVDRAIAVATGAAPIDAAILDINLRDSLVYPVVSLLRDRGIAIVFATSRTSGIPEEFSDIPIVPKPASAARILTALKN